jgi:hypothetical protein
MTPCPAKSWGPVRSRYHIVAVSDGVASELRGPGARGKTGQRQKCGRVGGEWRYAGGN